MTRAGSFAEGPILLATDFSDDSEAAFGWAARAARSFGAPLHVLHVVHDPLDAPGAYAGNDGSSLEKLEDVAGEMLDAWIERMKSERTRSKRQDDAEPPLDIVASIAVGLPETRILEVAEREGARMIVMGGKGRSSLSNILLGSRAEHVTRRAPMPVTVVRDSVPTDDPSEADTSTERAT